MVSSREKEKLLQKEINWRIAFMKGQVYLTYELDISNRDLYRVIYLDEGNANILYEALYTRKLRALIDFFRLCENVGGELVDFEENKRKRQRKAQQKYSNVG